MQLSPPVANSPVGLLLSGGLDSAILAGVLAQSGQGVQPIYIRAGLRWEAAELSATRRFLAALGGGAVGPLVVLDVPVADLYGQHWSTTGAAVPDAGTPDEAVYLPGRNALLVTKAGLWCQLHDIRQLALAPLASNPFPDATDEFFSSLERTLTLGAARELRIWRPFARWHKIDVLRLGAELPLAETFSCIDPVGERHCGACNKCHERQQAFLAAGLTDPTPYAGGPESVTAFHTV